MVNQSIYIGHHVLYSLVESKQQAYQEQKHSRPDLINKGKALCFLTWKEGSQTSEHRPLRLDLQDGGARTKDDVWDRPQEVGADAGSM
jgi:hypothetical protein